MQHWERNIATDVMSRFRLDGRNAVVTGGSRGIGQAIARGLAQAGARVVITCREETPDALSFLNELKQAGHPESRLLICEVSDPSDVKRLVDDVLLDWDRVHILVNNAGINILGAAENYDLEDFDRVLDVNLRGVFLCSQLFGRQMIQNGGGSIINIGSMSAEIVNRPAKHAVYNASKAAVHMLSKCLAVEWAPHEIRVNVIAPGFHATDMVREVMSADPATARTWIDNIAQKRIADPNELAGLAVFLASDASSYMTGAVLMSDGGYTLL